MSEKQAKRSRRETAAAQTEKKRKNPGKAVSNIVIAAVIAAVAALGVYATWDKIEPMFHIGHNHSEEEAQSQTIAEYAESTGTTAEELLEKCGMTDTGLSGDSDMSEMEELLTIDSYAKFNDKTADEVKKENGIEALADDTKWSEAVMQIPMSKVAEQSGMSFADFVSQYSLPEEITEDMTQGEAIEVMQNANTENTAE